MKKKAKRIDPAQRLVNKWFPILGWKNNKPVKCITKNYKKIELASQKKTDKLQPFIDKILKAFGQSEALVTDESIVADFIDVFDKEERIKQVKEAKKKLKVELYPGDYLWEVAERMAK